MSNVVEGDEAHAEFAKWICETKRGFDSLEAAQAAAVRSIARDTSLKALYW